MRTGPQRCCELRFACNTGPRGSVLVLALWSLFFLGALALAIGAHVSADLRVASSLKAEATARALARAGVERAVMEILRNTTNWDGVADAELGSDESLFKDNDSLPGGRFTVSYTYLVGGSGVIATNFGIVRETRKININSRRSGARERLIGLGVPGSVADNILGWPSRKKKRLAKQGRTGYPAVYESLHELLVVDGVTDEVYTRILPHVTIFRGSAYGGVSEGTAGEGLAVRRIAFVFDRKRALFVHWHEL